MYLYFVIGESFVNNLFQHLIIAFKSFSLAMSVSLVSRTASSASSTIDGTIADSCWSLGRLVKCLHTLMCFYQSLQVLRFDRMEMFWSYLRLSLVILMIPRVVCLFSIFICIIKWDWWIFGIGFLQIAEKQYKIIL